MLAPLYGSCDPALPAVRAALAENLERGDVGAGLCVMVDGRVVRRIRQPLSSNLRAYAEPGIRIRSST